MTGKDDHDSLIRLETSLQHICVKFDKLEGKIDKFIDVCDCKFKTKASWKPFLTVVGAVVVIISSIIGYNYTIDNIQWKAISNNKESISNNKVEIRVLQEKHTKDTQ